MIKRLAKIGLLLALSLALLCPSWAANSNTPVLKIQDGEGSIQLTLQNLGQQTVHSVQLELTMNGTYSQVSFSQANASWYSRYRVEEQNRGQTHITIYIDSRETINLNGTASLGTLELGGSYTAPSSAGLILLNHRLESDSDVAVSIPVQNTSNSSNGNTSNNTPSPSVGTEDGDSSSTDDGYSIYVPNRVTGGSVTVRPSSASAGSRVTITARPNAGYEVKTVTVTDRNGKPVPVTEGSGGTYTFVMPNSRVDVKAEFVRTQTAASDAGFTDVSSGAWYYSAVQYVQERGLMNGVGNGHFEPDSNLSRAQLAQILYNASGHPASTGSSFADVPAGQWYSDAVGWAAQNGIVSGYGNGKFGPNDNITREQLAVMLWRYAGQPASRDGTLQFKDVSQVSGYAVQAISWAVEQGILNGYGEGILAPGGLATRAQVASMLMRYMG